jgi:hypothetical protein
MYVDFDFASKMATQTPDAIRVVCRFRPQNNRELSEGGVHVVDFDKNLTAVKCEVQLFDVEQRSSWNLSI